MSEELKACPFCGQTAHVSDSFIDAEQVGCFYCVAFVDTDIWNHRPIEDALQSEIERLTERVKKLEAEVEESNGLLRSTYQIASRDGKDTNWEAFRNQVHIALVRQHEQMYGEESEEE